MEDFQSFFPVPCSVVKVEALPDFNNKADLTSALRHVPPGVVTPHLQDDPAISQVIPEPRQY